MLARNNHTSDDDNSMENDDGTVKSANSSVITDTTPHKTKFQRGDHVYQWCSVAGVPRVFQHHGIVMHVSLLPGDKEGEVKEHLTIADFSNFLPEICSMSTHSQEVSMMTNETESDRGKSPPSKKSKTQEGTSSSFSGGLGTGGILRVYTTTTSTDLAHWHKVEYNAPRWKTLFCRSGVSTTAAASDSPEVVLSRVNFLLVQAEREAHDTFRSSVLPKYHLLFANCECVATWCKTGKWTTLQGASCLAGATWGGTVAIGQAAAAQEATVAVTPGLMSVLGGSAMTAGAPSWVIPAIAAYGAMAVGSSAGTLLLARSKWDATAKRLNEALSQEHSCATPLSLM